MMKTLNEDTVHRNPIKQFAQWFEEAQAAKLPIPEAMTLATVSPDGKPSARIVLLKEVNERGFIFYTNYLSRKGKELSMNPSASLVFYWNALERQVRIEGSVGKISAEESDRYFQSRPRESRISAIVSPQSEVVAGREDLELKWKELDREFAGKQVPRPPHWGGYCLKPDCIEFWRGRESRLHDRILYELQMDGTWKICRLAP